MDATGSIGEIGSERALVGPARLTGAALTLDDQAVVSPCAGRFRSVPPVTFTAEGEVVGTGQIVGYVDAHDGPVPVRAQSPGWVMGVLVSDGDPVQRGQPVLGLRPL